MAAFEQKWGAKYPTIGKQWRRHWGDIIAVFDFPEPIRKVIYTTNAIESVNSVIRKFTRNRKAVSQRGECVEVGVDGDPRSVVEVDDADRGLEGGIEPLRNRVRRPPANAHAELTSKHRSQRP